MSSELLNCSGIFFPPIVPNLFDTQISDVLKCFDDMFKKPIRCHFSYPIDIVRVSNDKGEVEKYVFKVALAGISKDEIKVRIKNNEYFEIDVTPEKGKVEADGSENLTYISKCISYRNSHISFKLLSGVDMERFKPVFKDGLLTVELYLKKSEDNVFEAEID